MGVRIRVLMREGHSIGTIGWSDKLGGEQLIVPCEH